MKRRVRPLPILVLLCALSLTGIQQAAVGQVSEAEAFLSESVTLKLRARPGPELKPADDLGETAQTFGMLRDIMKNYAHVCQDRMVVDASYCTMALRAYADDDVLIALAKSTVSQEVVEQAIDGLVTNGSTNVYEGLELAYDMARKHYEPAKVNRLILCSDGVANNGASTEAEKILSLVRRSSDEGITISTIGFGMGNYNDVMMEKLANKGDGNYYYVDRPEEAERVFRENLTGLLQTIAREVKVQVAFDPLVVKRWRLLGYENRDVADRDFRNDEVDAAHASGIVERRVDEGSDCVGDGHLLEEAHEDQDRALPVLPDLFPPRGGPGPQGRACDDWQHGAGLRRTAGRENCPRKMRPARACLFYADSLDRCRWCGGSGGGRGGCRFHR